MRGRGVRGLLQWSRCPGAVGKLSEGEQVTPVEPNTAHCVTTLAGLLRSWRLLRLRRWPKVAGSVCMVATVALLAIAPLVKVTDLRLVDAVRDAEVGLPVREAAVLPGVA